MSTLLKVFKALFNVFCGGESNKPQEQYTPPVHQPEHHQPVSQPLPHQPSPHYPPAHRPQKYEDDNQKNQQNEYYINLRARANKEGDEMARCFGESHEAYNRGDGARAKELSNQGKKHQQKMEQLNKEASDWIFVENNRDSKPGEIDLHGLYVKEAIARTDIALEEAKRRGENEIRLIVGKGLHSKGGAAKIRPAIEELMRKHQLVAELDPSNSGVLVVEFNGARGRGVRPDEIVRRLDRDDGGCIIM
ncbi:cytoplasmic protein [Armillaria mellea]|nr:cytoplasmic protein [Armillaria mellea]